MENFKVWDRGRAKIKLTERVRIREGDVETREKVTVDLNKFSPFLDGVWLVRYPLGPAGGGHVRPWAFTLMG